MGFKLKENQPIGRIIPDTNRLKSKTISKYFNISSLCY